MNCPVCRRAGLMVDPHGGQARSSVRLHMQCMACGLTWWVCGNEAATPGSMLDLYFEDGCREGGQFEVSDSQG